jgi:hypothetical protein
MFFTPSQLPPDSLNIPRIPSHRYKNQFFIKTWPTRRAFLFN